MFRLMFHSMAVEAAVLVFPDLRVSEVQLVLPALRVIQGQRVTMVSVVPAVRRVFLALPDSEGFRVLPDLLEKTERMDSLVLRVPLVLLVPKVLLDLSERLVLLANVVRSAQLVLLVPEVFRGFRAQLVRLDHRA
nr:MAG TPA: hypothetical protein [Caudoviricetes sp.]